MKRQAFCTIYLTGMLWAGFLFSSCGGEPFSYTPSNEVKPGPGLFSGPDGEFTLVGPEKDEEKTDENDGSQEVE